MIIPYLWKLLYFVNWCSGELSKTAKIWLRQFSMYVKNDVNLSKEISLNNTLGAHILTTSISKALYFLKKNDA